MNQTIQDTLKEDGYFNIVEIPNRGVCGLIRMIFTIGLAYGIDESGNYTGRYCFGNLSDAKEAIDNWNGIGDPDGDWIKHKGKVEYSNPKNF